MRSTQRSNSGVRFIAVVNYAPNVWKAELHPAGQGVEDYDTHFAMAR